MLPWNPSGVSIISVDAVRILLKHGFDPNTNLITRPYSKKRTPWTSLLRSIQEYAHLEGSRSEQELFLSLKILIQSGADLSNTETIESQIRRSVSSDNATSLIKLIHQKKREKRLHSKALRWLLQKTAT
jgi:hypothetical protein